MVEIDEDLDRVYTTVKRTIIDGVTYELQRGKPCQKEDEPPTDFRVVSDTQTFEEVKGSANLFCLSLSGSRRPEFLTQKELDKIGAGQFSVIKKIRWETVKPDDVIDNSSRC